MEVPDFSLETKFFSINDIYFKNSKPTRKHVYNKKILFSENKIKEHMIILRDYIYKCYYVFLEKLKPKNQRYRNTIN